MRIIKTKNIKSLAAVIFNAIKTQLSGLKRGILFSKKKNLMIVALIFFIKLLTLSISFVAVLRRMETEAVVTAQDKGKNKRQLFY